jgi:hypothetical protein
MLAGQGGGRLCIPELESGDVEQSAGASKGGTGSEMKACFASSLSHVGHWKNPTYRHLRSRKEDSVQLLWAAAHRSTEALTLRVGFLEGVAGIHKAGGCIVLTLELEVQLGGLAESVPGSWNTRAQHRGPGFCGSAQRFYKNPRVPKSSNGWLQ